MYTIRRPPARASQPAGKDGPELATRPLIGGLVGAVVSQVKGRPTSYWWTPLLGRLGPIKRALLLPHIPITLGISSAPASRPASHALATALRLTASPCCSSARLPSRPYRQLFSPAR